MAKKRVFVVYVIRNLLDGKRYIGKTSGRSVFVAIETRWKRHLSDALKGRGFYLHQAIRKHGVENFEIGHLHVCKTECGAFALEVREIARFAPEYNMTAGGDGVVGHKWTESQRAAITGRKGQSLSPERIAALSSLHRGVPKSPATRAKISKALTGKKRGPMKEEQKQRYRELFAGRPITPEHARKISLGKLGKPYKLTKLRQATIAIRQARESGSKFYSTGVPCNMGHVSPRYVSTRQCCECHRFRSIGLSQSHMEMQL